MRLTVTCFRSDISGTDQSSAVSLRTPQKTDCFTVDLHGFVGVTPEQPAAACYRYMQFFTMNTDAALLLETVNFAAEKHRSQRRKDAEATPYINHPIGRRVAAAKCLHKSTRK